MFTAAWHQQKQRQEEVQGPKRISLSLSLFPKFLSSHSYWTLATRTVRLNYIKGGERGITEKEQEEPKLLGRNRPTGRSPSLFVSAGKEGEEITLVATGLVGRNDRVSTQPHKRRTGPLQWWENERNVGEKGEKKTLVHQTNFGSRLLLGPFFWLNPQDERARLTPRPLFLLGHHHLQVFYYSWLMVGRLGRRRRRL